VKSNHSQVRQLLTRQTSAFDICVNLSWCSPTPIGFFRRCLTVVEGLFKPASKVDPRTFRSAPVGIWARIKRFFWNRVDRNAVQTNQQKVVNGAKSVARKVVRAGSGFIKKVHQLHLIEALKEAIESGKKPTPAPAKPEKKPRRRGDDSEI
jgi:hypothetical protein